MHWVSTTAFLTHCLKKVRRTLERVLLAWGLLLSCSMALAGAEFEQLRVERQDGALVLTASLTLELGPAVEDALLKGVSVHFVAEAELMRDRWYWYDQKVAQVSRHYRLAYQPLTRQWRLQVASEPAPDRLEAGRSGRTGTRCAPVPELPLSPGHLATASPFPDRCRQPVGLGIGPEPHPAPAGGALTWPCATVVRSSCR